MRLETRYTLMSNDRSPAISRLYYYGTEATSSSLFFLIEKMIVSRSGICRYTGICRQKQDRCNTSMKVIIFSDRHGINISHRHGNPLTSLQ